jgi:transitional endoplasmic reticulum ATPase
MEHREDPRPTRARFGTRTSVVTAAHAEFEQQLLKLKMSPMDERLALLRDLSEREQLTLTQRRQLLMAVQRYILGSGSEMPRELSGVLTAVLSLATQLELKLKALELFNSALEQLPRGEILPQLQQPLLNLLKSLLPKGSPGTFSPETFVRAARRLETLRSGDGLIHLASLGLYFFPFNRTLREMRADYHMLEGNTSAARNDFDQLIEQYPDRVEYRLDRAEASIRLDDFEYCLDDLAIYLRGNPDDITALRRQAECFYQIGRFLDSMRLLNRLIELEGERVNLLLNRARVNEQLDFLEEAVQDAEAALKLDPASQEARQLKHSLLLKRQSYGIEDDVYNAFARGDDEAVLGDVKIPETRFSDIGGLDNVKRQIRETIEYPLKYAELSARYGKKAGGGLLFFGPPGCGKTLLARAAAGECEVALVNVNLASVLDKWVGNTEKAVSMVFAAARKRAPAILFFDEVDAIGGSRANLQTGWEKKLISQLLIELDGLNSRNDNVMVLGATNAPWDVDFALRRPGRLGNLVFVPPPSAEERAAIFGLYLKQKPFVAEDLDLAELALLSEHHSADSIRQVVENAAAIPWRNAIETGDAQPLAMEHLRQALQQAAPDLVEWEKLVSRYQEFASKSLAKPAIGFRKRRRSEAH